MKTGKAVKLCECGCGQPTPIAKKTSRRDGRVKGQPLRFVRGHDKRRSLEQAFRAGFAPGHPNKCWEWQSTITDSGYGVVVYGGSRHARAHRASYQIHRGPIPKGMSVCHKCDNRRCVNPNHLFLGTQADNMVDMARKGRSVTKLTPNQVKQIRALWQRGGVTQGNIAAQFGIARRNVSDIVNRKTWKHI